MIDYVQSPDAGVRVPYTLDWGDDYPGDPVADATFDVLLNGAPSTDATVSDVQFADSLVTFTVTSVSPVQGELYTMKNRVTLASGIIDVWDVVFAFESSGT